MAQQSKPTSLTGAAERGPARKGRPPKSATASQLPTRQRIVMAAAETMLTRGIQGLSMEQVAHKVGVTPGALYRHFIDRAHLVRETAEYVLSAYAPIETWLTVDSVIDMTHVPTTASALGWPAAESIRRFTVDLLTTALNDPEFLAQIRELNTKLLATLERSIEAGQQAGKIDAELSARYAARWVLVQLGGLAAVDVIDPALAHEPEWRTFVAARMRDALGLR